MSSRGYQDLFEQFKLINCHDEPCLQQLALLLVT